MKSNPIAALFGATLASAAFLAAPAFLPVDAGAADPDAAAVPLAGPAVAPVKDREQYKLMSLAPFQNDANTRRMEDALNRLAADGWRVKTGVGIALVLSR